MMIKDKGTKNTKCWKFFLNPQFNGLVFFVSSCLLSNLGGLHG
jgi:hypothetical protein